MRTPTKRYSETIRNLAPILAEHVDGRDILRALVSYERANGADAEWDIAEAMYWIGANLHSGQNCPLYAAMCATQFSPGACARGPENSYLYEQIVMILA
jgi:hypothetical protein